MGDGHENATTDLLAIGLPFLSVILTFGYLDKGFPISRTSF